MVTIPKSGAYLVAGTAHRRKIAIDKSKAKTECFDLIFAILKMAKGNEKIGLKTSGVNMNDLD